MANANEEKKSGERRGDAPVFERRLKDVRVACWRNESDARGEPDSHGESEGRRRVWFHTMLSRTYRRAEDLHEAAGSLNGVPDIVLAMAGLEAVKQFIEQQPEG